MNIIIAAILAAPFLTNGANPDKEGKEAVEAFKAVYFAEHAEEIERVVAIQRLASTPHMSTARMLGQLLFTAPSAHQVEAAIALHGFYEIRGTSILASAALLAPASLEKTELRIALIQTLGSLQKLGSLPILHQLITDTDLPVALAAIKTIPLFERGESLAILLHGSREAARKGDGKSLQRRIALQEALSDLRDNLDRR